MNKEASNGNKLFQPGMTYSTSDWFTGGTQRYICRERTEHTVSFSLYSAEADGISYAENLIYDICMDDNGNEYVILCEYHGNKHTLNA